MTPAPLRIDPPDGRAWLPTSVRVRSLFAAAAAVLAAVLLASALSAYRGAEALSNTVTRSQGVMLMHAVRRGIGRDAPPSAEDLQAVLVEGEELGLVHLRYTDEVGGHVVEVGEAAPARSLVRGDDFQVVRDHDAARVSAPVKPPPGHTGPTARVELEFVPHQALEIERWAERDLAIAIAGTGLLALVTTVFWAMARRAELVERRWIEQRHLAALGEMSAVLAHELRNPLSALKGHAQLLEEQLDGKSRVKAGRVVESAVRLEHLVDGLLGFVRSGKLVRTPVDPAEVGRAAASAFAGAAIELDLEDAPRSWSLDGERTQQVLVNLLDNALAVSDGAPVSLRVARVDDQLLFEVRDHGPGIAASEREAIFEPFHTTKARGAGLGLAVSRRIVEAHGGTIEVADGVDGGAVLRVRIPIAAGGY